MADTCAYNGQLASGDNTVVPAVAYGVVVMVFQDNTGRVAALVMVALAEQRPPLEPSRRSDAMSLSGVCWPGISRGVKTVATQCKFSYGKMGSLHEGGARDDCQRIAMPK